MGGGGGGERGSEKAQKAKSVKDEEYGRERSSLAYLVLSCLILNSFLVKDEGFIDPVFGHSPSPALIISSVPSHPDLSLPRGSVCPLKKHPSVRRSKLLTLDSRKPDLSAYLLNFEATNIKRHQRNSGGRYHKLQHQLSDKRGDVGRSSYRVPTRMDTWTARKQTVRKKGNAMSKELRGSKLKMRLEIRMGGGGGLSRRYRYCEQEGLTSLSQLADICR